MMNFERIILDEWRYIPLMVLAMLWAWSWGFAIGSVWVWL